MPTLQSPRHKRQRGSRWARANAPAAIARRLAAAEVARMAAPPPIYPHERQPGTQTGDYIEARIHGVLVRADRAAPHASRRGVRPRSDQFAVSIDGEAWATCAGLVALFDELRARLPRAMSRRAIAALQPGDFAPEEDSCYSKRSLLKNWTCVSGNDGP